MKVLDANKLVPAIQFTGIGCSMVACIQSVSSEINYHIGTTMNAGINAVKIIKVLDTKNWCQPYSLKVLDAVLFHVYKVFPVKIIII